MVITHWSATGTHKGVFMGKEPTNEAITVYGFSMDRFDPEGNVVESWVCPGLIPLFVQLGVSLVAEE